jgi:hypothetical protein
MDYETARRVRSNSIKQLTIRNLVNGQGLIGSVKGAIGSKVKSYATKQIEKFDPLNWINMLNSPLTTAIAGRLTGRKGSTIKYYLDKQKREKNAHYSKISPGRATKLRVGDSTADILAKMFNLMQKDHDEAIKRMELDAEHNQQRNEEEEKRHQELLKAISMAGHKVEEPKEDKEKNKPLKEKLESILGEVMKPFKEIGLFFKGVMVFVGEAFLTMGKGILKVIETIGEIGKIIFETVSNVALKVIEFIGPILTKAFSAVEKLVLKIIKIIAQHEAKLLFGGGGSGGTPSLSGGGSNQKSQTSGTGKTLMKKYGTILGGGLASATVFAGYEKIKGDSKSKENNESMLTKALKDMGYLTLAEAAAAGVGATAGFLMGGPPGALVGAEYGNVGFNALLAFKTLIYDPYKSAQDKENMLYYGPVAMEEMANTGKQPSDNEIAPMILDYQIKTLIPLLGSQGLILPDKNHYDWYAMKPIFFDAEEVKNMKKGETVEAVTGVELATRLSEAILKKQTGIDLRNLKSIPENLKDEFVKKIESQITPVQGFFDKKIDLVKGSLSDEFNKVQQMYKNLIDADDHGATLVMPTVTNTFGVPDDATITGTAIGIVRSTESSLRQCQSNYAIAC